MKALPTLDAAMADRVAAAKQLRAHVEEATRCDFYARHEVNP